MAFRGPHTPLPPPDVSVLMTIRNGEAFVRQAIESVFAQATDARWELIVVDDGSTDGSAAAVRAFCERDPERVRLLQHAGGVNRGISASRNLALRHARAPLVAFLDCDDVFLPHHLRCQMDVLRLHPEVAMVYASAERWVHYDRAFDADAAERSWWGENYVPPLVPAGTGCGVLPPGTLLAWMLQDESFAPCMCTVVVRTRAALAVGGFDEEFEGLYDDQVFHAKLAGGSHVYANGVPTARYRQHGTSCCAQAAKDPQVRALGNEHFAGWIERFQRGGDRG